MVSPLLLRAGINYQLRHRWQAFLALLGISMGVAVVLAVDLANSAAKATFELSAAQIRGAATHRVTGVDGRVPLAWYQAYFTEPHLPAAAPVVSGRVRHVESETSLQLVGLDIFVEGPFRGQLSSTVTNTDLGDWLSAPNLVMLSRSAAESLGVQTGDTLTIRANGRQHVLQVAFAHEETSAATRDLLLVDIATAQAVLQMPEHISYLDLIASPDELPRVQALLAPGLQLISIDEQTEGTVNLSAAFELNLTAMSLLAMLVGLFLIYNAMSFSIVQRRNLFGRLRAVGTQPGEIYRVVLAEALLLGLVGSLIGVWLGIWLGQGLTQLVAGTISELYYRVSIDAQQLSLLPVLKGVGLGVGGTLVAALIPAYQAASTPPVSTLSRADLETRAVRWLPKLALTGAVAAILGLLIAFVVPGGLLAGLLGLFVLIMGMLLITPATIPLFHWLLQHLPLRGIWRLAVRDLTRHVSRLGTAAAALMIALAAAISVAVMVQSMRTAVSDWLLAALNADLYIATEDFVDRTTLPDGLVKELEQLGTISAISRYRSRKVELGGRPLTIIAADIAEKSRLGFRFTDVPTEQAWQAWAEGAVLISEPLSNRLQLGAGDRIVLPSPGGEHEYRVAGVFRDFASEHGRLFMPLPIYRDTWHDKSVATLGLFSDSLSAAELKHQIYRMLPADTPLLLTEAEMVYRESMTVFERTFRITNVLRGLSLGVAVVGILSALMAIQLQRRKEFAVLRALGMTHRQLAGLILIESLLLGVIAALMALPTGILMAWVLTGAVQFKAFGWTMPLVLDAGPLAFNLGLGILAAALAALYPAWRASRYQPAPQLRED